jgi:hypothetical protein
VGGRIVTEPDTETGPTAAAPCAFCDQPRTEAIHGAPPQIRIDGTLHPACVDCRRGYSANAALGRQVLRARLYGDEDATLTEDLS